MNIAKYHFISLTDHDNLLYLKIFSTVFLYKMITLVKSIFLYFENLNEK